MVLAFGKYSGMDLKDVPADYLQWMLDNDKKRTDEFQGELDRRKRVEEADASLTERIAKEGFRKLSQEMHPDKGGTQQQFLDLKAAYDQLMMAIREIKNVTSTGA